MNTSCQHSVYAIRGSVIISRIVARSNFGVFRQESSPQSPTAYSLNRQTAQKHQRMFLRDKNSII